MTRKKRSSCDSLEHALGRALGEAERRKKAEAVAAEIRQQKAQALLHAAEKDEEEHADEKRAVADTIFSWARVFSQTDLYHRLLDAVLPVVPPAGRKLYVFGGGWGHELPYKPDGYGCWSRLYLLPEGNFFYAAGYKWFPSSPTFSIKTPRELESKLCHGYLKEFAQTLQSGEVYDAIQGWYPIFSKEK
ncbi:MAG: hypothetical protein Q8R53_01200 [Nanoarchaeota archaeon]|nr:hypothetical protein [Nanoarchaeota archaeon]